MEPSNASGASNIGNHLAWRGARLSCSLPAAAIKSEISVLGVNVVEAYRTHRRRRAASLRFPSSAASGMWRERGPRSDACAPATARFARHRRRRLSWHGRRADAAWSRHRFGRWAARPLWDRARFGRRGADTAGLYCRGGLSGAACRLRARRLSRHPRQYVPPACRHCPAGARFPHHHSLLAPYPSYISHYSPPMMTRGTGARPSHG